MPRAPTPRVLRVAALLWLMHGLLLGATPASQSRARLEHDRPEPNAIGKPGRMRFMVMDEHDAPVFARVTLRASDGAAHEAFSFGARGGELSLPAGSYELRASRGPEWSI